MDEVYRHPYHPHPLAKTDTRLLYNDYESRWRCDICSTSYDGRSNDIKQRFSYHCVQCTPPDYFDCCMDCFRGHFHTFHHHRLQPAISNICYSFNNGLWNCDACLRQFSDSTSSINYHCQQCNIDLCRECFDGKWKHVLHSDGEHTLIPIDPRIEYRCYSSWSCDVCNVVGTHGPNLWLLYHCKECQLDICSKCFQGYTHQLHPHGLVKDVRAANVLLHCSACNKSLFNDRYCCIYPECSFFLCNDCFKMPPKTHPLHPTHPLYMSNSSLVYPESGGNWHCDNCNGTHPQATPLTSKDVMYHCDTCQFDLCQKCYKYDPTPSPWLQQAQPLSQQYNYFASKEQYKRPLVQRPSVNFIPSPPTSLPAPGICRVCGLATAKVTTVHNGRAHSEALYCVDCAKTIVSTREKCYKCGIIPDGIINIIN